jgi:FkbM family methyltransferase
MGRLKSFGARTLRRAGFVVSRTPPPGSLPRKLRELFAALDVSCVVDVGANKGQYARMLREEVGFTGRIASVEPARGPFRTLTDAMHGDSDWSGFQLALGAREEAAAVLHTASIDEFSSMYTLNAYASARFGPTEIGSETVTVRRLDAVFDELVAGHQRVFLKCDTQGHDLAVVEGLGDRTVVGIQVELSFIPVYDEMPGFVEVVEALAARGYGPTAFFPVSRAEDGLRLVEADGVFIRT